MLQAIRTYGLMVFIAALLISSLLQVWTGKPVAILLVTLAFAVFSAVNYQRASCTQADWQTVRRPPDLWLTILGKGVFWGITLTLLMLQEQIWPWLGFVFFFVFISWRMAALPQTHIETGLIPVGALGVMGSVLALGLPLSTTVYVGIMSLLGAMGALFIMPLQALLTYLATPEHQTKASRIDVLTQTLIMFCLPVAAHYCCG